MLLFSLQISDILKLHNIAPSWRVCLTAAEDRTQLSSGSSGGAFRLQGSVRLAGLHDKLMKKGLQK